MNITVGPKGVEVPRSATIQTVREVSTEEPGAERGYDPDRAKLLTQQEPPEAPGTALPPPSAGHTPGTFSAKNAKELTAARTFSSGNVVQVDFAAFSAAELATGILREKSKKKPNLDIIVKAQDELYARLKNAKGEDFAAILALGERTPAEMFDALDHLPQDSSDPNVDSAHERSTTAWMRRNTLAAKVSSLWKNGALKLTWKQKAQIITAMQPHATWKREESLARDLLCSVEGRELGKLMTAIRQGRDRYDLQHLLFRDIDRLDHRTAMLQHIWTQTFPQLGLAGKQYNPNEQPEVLLDDLVASIGKNKGSQAENNARRAIGVIRNFDLPDGLKEATINLITLAMHLDRTARLRHPAFEYEKAAGTDLDETMRAYHNEEDLEENMPYPAHGSLREAIAGSEQFVVTAQPEFREEYYTIELLKKLGIPDIPVSSGGNLLNWRDPDLKTVDKIVNLVQQMMLRPDREMVVFGDDTERDPMVYALMVALFPDRIAGAFIHRRTKKDFPQLKAGPELDYSDVQSFNTYVGAAIAAFEAGWIGKDQLFKVARNAVIEFDKLEDPKAGDWPKEWIKEWEGWKGSPGHARALKDLQADLGRLQELDAKMLASVGVELSD